MDSLFRNTLGPAAWAVMAAIPLAILALYFLKLKRQPLEVPSTYLWHRVIEDLHVNSFWQKLRKSILLFLQLLVAALAILALLRPGWQGQTLEGRKFIFLIDNSASMSANDAEDASTRLEEAKNRVAALVDQMESSMSAMIMTFAAEPVVVQEFTSNRRQLREALTRIEPTSAQTDLKGAIRLADGFANPRRKSSEVENAEDLETAEPANVPVELYIFSDGRFPSVDDMELGNLQPQFLPLGSADTNNLAITTLSTRRAEANPEQVQVFAQVSNASSSDTTADVALYRGDQLVDALEATIPAKGMSSASFLLLDDTPAPLRAVVTPSADYGDSLALDNTAHAILEDDRTARVLLVTPGNRALELALQTERAKRFAKIDQVAPTELKRPDIEKRLDRESFDLIIYDQCVPEKMPAANTLFIGNLPPIKAWIDEQNSETIVGPQIVDWDRSHPLLNLIELGGVQIAGAQIVKPPAGGRMLVDSTDGPLVSMAPRGRFEDLVLGFEIVGNNEAGERIINTNWPRKHSFPSFWLNVLEHFARDSGSQSVHRPGEVVELRLAPAAGSATVETPDGLRLEVPVDATGRMAFQQTERLGTYQVYQDGELAKRFSVNLFDRDESDVALRVSETGEDGLNIVENLTIGFVEVVAQPRNADIRKELWKWLLVLALVVLIAEWYIYNRRVYI
jgi:hypothetical protein